MDDIKQYLQQRKGEQLELEELIDRRREAYAAMLPGCVTYDKVRVQSSPNMDPMADGMIQVEKITQRIEEIVRRQQEAFELIGRLKDQRQRRVLEIYYLSRDRTTWDDVADRMGYAPGYVYELHRKAIENLSISEYQV